MIPSYYRWTGVLLVIITVNGLSYCPVVAEPPRSVSKTLFLSAPSDGAIWARTFYTQSKDGPGRLELMCLTSIERRSDIPEQMQQRRSSDNGKTWSAGEPAGLREKTPQGVHYICPLPAWIDPVNGRMLQMVGEAVLPHDTPSEWLTQSTIRYRVSTDGGRTFIVDEPVVQNGKNGNFTATHPFEGVWVGKNAIYMGLPSSVAVRTRQGKILVPVNISPGARDFADAAVLIGTWTDNMHIEWNLSERVVADISKSTRGWSEPTIAEMPDGRILMLMRGDNYANPALPGYKWFCVSNDGGLHWSKPAAWTYADGSKFYSPSSMSQLLQHSNGKCYWIGNICSTNPRGNPPRYPLVIGEVSPDNMLLLKDTITVIDTKGDDDPGNLELSNFLAREDRVTGEIVVDLTRLSYAGQFRGDAFTCRISVASEPSKRQ